MESLSQVGVQLLLFTLGLEFSLTKLKAVRNVALLGGVAQIGAFMVLAGLLATAIGASVHEGVFIGALVRGRPSTLLYVWGKLGVRALFGRALAT